MPHPHQRPLSLTQHQEPAGAALPPATSARAEPMPLAALMDPTAAERASAPSFSRPLSTALLTQHSSSVLLARQLSNERCQVPPGRLAPTFNAGRTIPDRLQHLPTPSSPSSLPPLPPLQPLQSLQSLRLQRHPSSTSLLSLRRSCSGASLQCSPTLRPPARAAPQLQQLTPPPSPPQQGRQTPRSSKSAAEMAGGNSAHVMVCIPPPHLEGIDTSLAGSLSVKLVRSLTSLNLDARRSAQLQASREPPARKHQLGSRLLANFFAAPRRLRKGRPRRVGPSEAAAEELPPEEASGAVGGDAELRHSYDDVKGAELVRRTSSCTVPQEKAERIHEQAAAIGGLPSTLQRHPSGDSAHGDSARVDAAEPPLLLVSASSGSQRLPPIAPLTASQAEPSATRQPSRTRPPLPPLPPLTPSAIRPSDSMAEEAPVAPAAVPTVASAAEPRTSNVRHGRTGMEQAAQKLARRGGFRDRRSGAWTLPEEDTDEPARTERLLAHPFALRRSCPGDKFQQREGFLLFRCNGNSRFGVAYRLLVLITMLIIGIISGLHPLVGPPGSASALAQTLAVVTLQLGLAFLCLRCHPDADRIISIFCGTQFLLEALSTLAMISASLQPPDGVQRWQEVAFSLALSAMAVPIVVVVEMRLVTPLILLLRTRKANKLALCAACYMLCAGLRRSIRKLLKALALSEAADEDEDDEGQPQQSNEGDGGGVDGDEPSATSDASTGGSDAAASGGEQARVAGVERSASSGYSLGGGGGADEDGEGDVGGGAAFDESLIAEDAVTKGAKLLARAAAAKEVDIKKVAVPAGDESTSLEGTTFGVTTTATTFAHRLRQRVEADNDDAADADADEGDDCGGDD